ncbi:MAG: sugar ABC transporter permease [Treponema sp.]|jgi:raffinose/stachyose/melibiose transport system permease protein|nr:sugar ABC transporter permease [Treponema sp.]
MKTKTIYPFWLLIPMLVLYTFFFMAPVVLGIGYSFTNWNTYSDVVKFTGFQNFIDIFSAKGSYSPMIVRSFIFTFFTVIFKIAVGLGLAVALNTNIRCKNLLRSFFFLPSNLSALIIGILFRSILSPNGIVNAVLRAAGLDFLATGWLGDPNTVLGAVILTEVWREAGLNMVMLLAGMQVIPADYYEASSIDGASGRAQFLKITVPLLFPVITVVTILDTIHGIKAFDLIFALTGGGPGRLTEVFNITVFNEFSSGRFGMSTAMGVVVFIIALIPAMLIKNTMTGERK